MLYHCVSFKLCMLACILKTSRLSAPDDDSGMGLTVREYDPNDDRGMGLIV